MGMRRLGGTDIQIAPLVLGCNVFGWTADKATSFAILDAFLDAGFNALDTADVYSRFAPGLEGGESETIIGAWMKDRGVRDRVVIITKCGHEMGEGMKGLGGAYIARAAEASLKRLQTDYIDVYLAHRADPATPIEETLGAHQKLIDAGKVRVVGGSNYSAEELSAARAAAGHGRARYEVLEPYYNLLERDKFEGALEKVCVNENIGVISYFSLASGFLTGKYRSEADLSGRARKGMVAAYLNPFGLGVLAALDGVAARHEASVAQVALAWLSARPSVTAPIVSATNVDQLADILKATALKLDRSDIAALDAASSTARP